MAKKQNVKKNNKKQANIQQKLQNVETANPINDLNVNHGHNVKNVALGLNTKKS